MGLPCSERVLRNPKAALSKSERKSDEYGRKSEHNSGGNESEDEEGIMLRGDGDYL